MVYSQKMNAQNQWFYFQAQCSPNQAETLDSESEIVCAVCGNKGAKSINEKTTVTTKYRVLCAVGRMKTK